jgi:hypothetical protein
MTYFDNNGRCIPSAEMRVFAKDPSNYYKINLKKINYEKSLTNLRSNGLINGELKLNTFVETLESIIDEIENNKKYKNLLNGVKFPFAILNKCNNEDIGLNLENFLLPKLKNSFTTNYPDCHFKAILQSDSKLKGQLNFYENSGMKELYNYSKKNLIIGWYFPQALQEFDINSQREQFALFDKLKKSKIALSGGIDTVSAMIADPEMLINENHYSPILCMSSYVHNDPRLVLLLKNYGPHLEFWLMTQMLTKTTTQVSEQWTGGITIYNNL